jgi:sec-independent protein translocase protein TatB
MLLIVAVAVVVIGPQELPRALYNAGKIVRKIKTFTGDIQKSLDKIMHDEELEDITREANRIGGPNLQFEIDRQYEEERRRIAGAEDKNTSAVKSGAVKSGDKA